MRYAPLFDLNIVHDYFVNFGSRVHEVLPTATQQLLQRDQDVARWLDVFPLPDTVSTLAGRGLLFKRTSRGFLCGVKLDPSSSAPRPAAVLDASMRLRFALRIKDPKFFNFTQLPTVRRDFFYFGSESANSAFGVRSLSRPVPVFDSARVYEAGDVRAEYGATVDLFVATRDSGPSATPVPADWVRIPEDTFDASASYTEASVVLSSNRLFRARVDGPGTDLTNTSDWQLVGTLANQYVTSADRITLAGTLHELDLSPTGQSLAVVRLFSGSSVRWEARFEAASGSLTTVALDLRSLATGAYELRVFDAAMAELPALRDQVYVCPAAVADSWFGVIEVGLGSGDFALLDGTGLLLSPTFSLRFLNRATRWRYVFPEEQPLGVGAQVAAEAGDARILVTDLPRPLTRVGESVLLQGDSAGTPSVNEEVLLPAPDASRVRRQNDQWFSEIHLSNLSL